MLTFLRRCVISLAGKDDKDIRVQQVSYNSKAENVEVWAPYGMSYNPPPNCLSLCVQIGEDQGNLVALPDRSQDRVKNLAEGEVAFFNPLTQTRTIYRADKSIEIVSEGGRTTTITEDDVTTVQGDKSVTVDGEMNITVTGDCNLTASNVNIDAATTNLGVGGNKIARLGDAVQVTVVGGSSAGVHSGTITSAGVNTSI